ncbi:kinase-like domain, phloem protein 2-like protein [Tanacetum coccineum]
MTYLTWVQRIKISLDIAHGLNYIHTNTNQDKQKIIHRDIKSANILLDDKWKAKIADFGLSKFHPTDQEASTFNASTIAGTPMYFDPEYHKSGKLNKKSDIYSFGVVLFEILTGSLANDFDNGIAPIARHHFEKGTLMKIVDHKIKEETDEHIFSLSKGPNKESFDIFSKIAFRCIAETQAERPSIDIVIDELKKAKSSEGEAEFMTELKILMEYKHDNVIGLLGYCDEEDEKIIVYEYASRGSLDKYLSDDSLTWVMRLLNNYASIFASGRMLALSAQCSGTIDYRDPLYSKTGFLTKESDIFSLGAVLFDILCGKLSSIELDDEYPYLPFLAKQHYHVGKLDKLVFEGIKEQIVPQSYTTFTRIALQCLHHRRERRPTAGEVIIQLRKHWNSK